MGTVYPMHIHGDVPNENSCMSCVYPGERGPNIPCVYPGRRSEQKSLYALCIFRGAWAQYTLCISRKSSQTKLAACPMYIQGGVGAIYPVYIQEDVRVDSRTGRQHNLGGLDLVLISCVHSRFLCNCKYCEGSVMKHRISEIFSD